MTRGRDIALIAGAALLGAGSSLCACSSGLKPDLASPVPAARIEAMGPASQRHDPSEIRQLIVHLDSDDAAVRLFAIATLEKITGHRRGYDPADPERKRVQAADRWQAWYGEEYGVGPSDDRWKEAGQMPGSGSGRGVGRATDHSP